MTAHPPFVTLVDEADSPEIREHLATCAACRAQVRLARAITGSDPSSLPGIDDARRAMERARADATRELSAPTSSLPFDAPGPPVDLSPGRVVERYVVEARIGGGGIGDVYRVRHQQLGSAHALKMLRRTSKDEHRRLLREGRAQSALRHPNVVPVTDVVDVDGAPGLVMELVDGPTLAALLKDGPLPLDEVDRLATQILRGVGAAHAAGVVHRDLKPANVLLQRSDGGWLAKVADFGLARVEGSDPGVTGGGVPLGTPAYMAPEQIRDARTADERSDVFSLGAVLYELLTGSRAFDAPDVLTTFERIRDGRYEPPEARRPDAPPRMRAAIAAALEVDPERRPPDVPTLLALWAGARPAPGAPRPRALGAAALWIGAAVVSAVVVAGVVALRSATDVEPPAPPAPPPVPAAIPDWSRATPLRVTALPNDLQVYAMALTPDGATVVFSDSRGLWRQRVGDPQPERLIDGGNFHAIDVLPDGARVFVAGGRGDVDGAWVLPLAGGEPTPLYADSGWVAALSPDGARVAQIDEQGLSVRALDGSGRRLVRALPSTVTTHGLEWSPDGRFVATIHSSANKGTAWLDVTAVDDGASQQLAESHDLVALGLAGLAWTAPDRLLVARATDAEAGGSVVYALDDASAATSFDGARPMREFTTWVTRLSPARDASRVAWHSVTARTQSALLDLERGGLTPATQDEWEQVPVDWIGDDALLLAGRTGGSAIVRQPLDGSPPTRVGTTTGGDVAIERFGDQVLAWSLLDPSKPWGCTIRSIPLAGGPAVERTRVPERRVGAHSLYDLHCAAASCVVSAPDGDRVRFSDYDPTTGVVGATWFEEPLTAPQVSWTLAPDASRVVTVRSMPKDLRVHDRTGAVERTVAHPLDYVHQVAWHTTERAWFVAGVEDPSEQPYRLLLVHDDGRVDELWRSATHLLFWPTPSPDGRTLAVGSVLFEDDVFLLDGI
jgi:hypothetical protein